jgi:hypothetical protein
MNSRPLSVSKKNLRCWLDVCFDKNFYIFSMNKFDVEITFTGIVFYFDSLMRSLIKSGVQLKNDEFFLQFNKHREE